MYRPSRTQRSLLEPTFLLPEKKVERLRGSWAELFREAALPLIREELFAVLFHQDNGRPNRPVKLVFGVLLLKEIFDLTDMDALEQLEWNLQWQHALALTPEEAHLAQKTLHNFRVGLMRMDGGYLLFKDMTDRILAVLGTNTQRQRLDSTHIISNVARLTRLGLFCETIRVFLRALRTSHPRLFRQLSDQLVARYLKDSDAATRYEGVKGDDVRRRLDVCVRDLGRLIKRYKGGVASAMEEFKLLERLAEEQCELADREVIPAEDDDDHGEAATDRVLKGAKEVDCSSLQTPHDPDVTFSGHKGKGYEVQVAETTSEANDVEIITHVDVTPSSGSDATATIPTIDELSQRGIQPKSLLVDTTYAGAENAVDAETAGTVLVGPVPGNHPGSEAVNDQLTAADFVLVLGEDVTATCPAGHQAVAAATVDTYTVTAVFDGSVCNRCPLFNRCPAQSNDEGAEYGVTIDLLQRNRERRRREQATPEFRAQYAPRAGIEATNSELKRAHGLGRLRVRGGLAVRLAVFLKTIACNVKRMVRALDARRAAARPKIG